MWAWYPDAKSAIIFPSIPGGPFEIGSVTIQTGDIFLFVAAPISMAILAYFVMKTRTGRGMQATAQDPDTAKLMGINTDRIIVVAFALGAAFAAIGGVAYGFKYGEINFRMGFILGLKAFTAAVLGGIGNIYGAMIGGLVLGPRRNHGHRLHRRRPRHVAARRPVLGQRLGLRTSHPRTPVQATGPAR